MTTGVQQQDIVNVLEQIDIVQQQSDAVYSWIVNQRCILEEDLEKVECLKVTLFLL